MTVKAISTTRNILKFEGVQPHIYWQRFAMLLRFRS